MSNVLTDVLAKRRDRAIAIILGVKERECDSILKSTPDGKAASDKLRKVVLDQMNELHDLYLDVMKSYDTGEVVLNEDYLAKLDEIHEAVLKRE
jgi:hypothetical protein